MSIRSKDHVLSLVESEKKALCPIDTKRWILSDGITTLPYRHWHIQAYKNMVKASISEEQAEKRAIKVSFQKNIKTNMCHTYLATDNKLDL